MISVVIPLYNKAGHIAQALESVLAQTVEASEIIVVDDGSTDHGDMKVLPFTKRGVRLISQQNQGVSVARNIGLQVAISDYVCFLDADDYWLPNHLEKLSDLLQKYPSAALWSTSHYIKRDGSLFAVKSALPPVWTGDATDFFRAYANGLSLVNSSTACVRRQALLDNGGFPVGVKRGEDIIAWVGLALSHGVAHAAVPTAVFNQEAANRTNTLREQDPPGSLQYLTSLISETRFGVEKKNSLRKLFNKIAFYTAAGFCLEGDKLGARKILSLAWQIQSYPTAIATSILLFVPTPALRLAKKLRHKKASRIENFL